MIKVPCGGFYLDESLIINENDELGVNSEYICGRILRCFGLQVWDYSDVPLNIDGLICVPFMFAWAALMIVAIVVDDLAKFYFFDGQRPHYHIWKWCIRLCPIEVN